MVGFNAKRSMTTRKSVWVAGCRLVSLAGSGLRGRTVALYALLAGLNVGAWIWAFAAFHHYPLLLGTALLAYTFGIRHAVDADHIAAIDNVTRKLMQDGKLAAAAIHARLSQKKAVAHG